MAIEPPPRIVDKFVNIWRDWLYFFWEFVDSHTGGSSPTPPATGTSWNAHGNVATGDDSNFLHIDKGAFIVATGESDDDTVGDVPPNMSGPGTGRIVGMAFLPGLDGAFRAGRIISANGYWDVGAIGGASIAMGFDAYAPAGNSYAIGQNVQALQTSCVAIGKDATADGLAGAWAIGTTVSATAAQAVAIGSSIDCNQNATIAVGKAITISATSSIGYGIGIEILGENSVANGVYLDVTGDNSVALGTGAGNLTRLTNNLDSTLMMGVNSDEPTFIMRNATGGTGTYAKIGIIFQDPLSTLDVGGSVGFKYTTLNATDGAIHNITGDEYTFRIDCVGFTSTQDEYTIQLPVISAAAIDRRVYYFKITDIAHVSGNHGTILIKPGLGQYIEDLGGGQGHRNPVNDPLGIVSGQAITIIANNTDQTWWVI